MFQTTNQYIYLLGVDGLKIWVFFVLWVQQIPEDVPIRKTEKLGNFGKTSAGFPLKFSGQARHVVCPNEIDLRLEWGDGKN